MKQLLLVGVLLLSGAWVAAQSTPSSSGSSQTGSSQSGSATSSQTGSEAGQSSGAQLSVEGCLSGSDGKYTLTDKQGTAYQLTGDTSKLAEHVGHEVRISGSAGSGAASAASAGGASQTLEVKSVKHISKTCQSGGMGK